MVQMSMYFFNNLYLEDRRQYSENNGFVRMFNCLTKLIAHEEFESDEVTGYSRMQTAALEVTKTLFEG